MTHAFPETTLRTGRLVLRPFTGADIPDTQASCTDELTQRWLPLPHPYTLADAADYCTVKATRARESGDGIHFAVTDTGSGRLLGDVSLKKTNWRALTSEVGYWVAPWARGRGIASEATRAVAEWLLSSRGFERLELRAATGNVASQRAAVNAGFTREGVLRNAGFTHSARVDLVVFSLIPADIGR